MLKFVLGALLLLMACSLGPLVSHAGESPGSPFDGMSAIDIEVAAALAEAAGSDSAKILSVEKSQASGSAVQFLQFDFVEVKGRGGHEGEFPIPGEPKPGPGTGLAQLSESVQVIQFRLETESGDLIEFIDLLSPEGASTGIEFLGDLTVPNQPFRIGATGSAEDDQPFDIVWEHLFIPQFVEVRFYPEILVVGSGPVELEATVTNHGPAGTFLIDTTTNLGLNVGSDLEELQLTEGESAPIVVTVTVPAISTGVLDILVTASATSIANTSVTNHGSTLVRTERFEKVFWSGFD